MKRILVVSAFLMTPSAFAAEPDTERGVSVFDANPRCMERTVDSNGPGCILRSAGAPRQFYPPVEAIEITPVFPNAPIMPPREAARSIPPQGR